MILLDALVVFHQAASAVPPDPGSSAGTTRFLREDATWVAPGSTPALLTGLCSGTASASSTLGLYGLGTVAIGCTNTIGATGVLISTARTVKNLRVLAITGGVNASSGVFTVLKNGAGTAITCTVGTGTSCTDLVNSASFAAGDRISIQFTTQAAETLGVVQATIELF